MPSTGWVLCQVSYKLTEYMYTYGVHIHVRLCSVMLIFSIDVLALYQTINYTNRRLQRGCIIDGTSSIIHIVEEPQSHICYIIEWLCWYMHQVRGLNGGDTGQGIHNTNFYVCTVQWCIVETYQYFNAEYGIDP